MSASLEQRVRFCTTRDGVRIAAATTGAGPPLVKAANWLNHLEFDNRSPVWRHWIRELSRDHTLVRYDERGCGLSEWEVEDFSLDAWVRDLEAVVDDLELERFALLGISQGGPIAVAYAARHPERVSRLILYGSYARGRSHRDLSEREREEGELMLKMIKVGWGTDHAAFRQAFTSMFIPEANAEQSHWFNELERVSATPENAARILAACHLLDVRDLAPRLDTPTLVLHITEDLRVPHEAGRQLASLIPGARFVTLEGRNHLLLESEPAWPRFLNEVREFLGVESSAPEASAPEAISAHPPTRAHPPSLPDAASRSRVEAVFDEALELAPAERPAFLERACAGDRRLRDEVEMMLQLAERSGLTARLAGAMARAGAGAAARAQQSAVSPGRRLSQYEILEPLGGGGMGVVYKALDRRLQRPVALKLLPPYLSGEQELKVRFLQEAEAIASLDHANICAVLEVEELDGGQLFMVMPFYEGETLKQKIARGPLAVAQALDYASQIAAGLAHAHAAGIVHRDIKPANVIVAPGERVKILDFGIAKLSHRNLTQTGTVLGTLSYMSPEQACGDPVDQRTDLWALGAVLYEMLAGVPPFAAASPEALYFAIQYRDPLNLTSFRSDLAPALVAIVHRLLEKDTARRYGDARELLAELERAGSPAGAAPTDKPDARPQTYVTGSGRSGAYLVGRAAEVDRLRELLRDVCRGARRVAFIGGEPGIGKSTLVEMFLDRVRSRQVRIGRGHCLEQHGAGEPYLPVLDALGRLCRERGGDELIAVLERYAPTWLVQMPSLLDAERLETVQRRAFGATRARMLREMVEALDAFTVDVPLLLVLEDLHWSDPSTLDFLAAVAQRPEPAQLLVLGTYRPCDAPSALTDLVGSLRTQDRCAVLALDGWPEADARAYLAARFTTGGLPAQIVELVLRRTDGHPLFVRSLVDEWQETGALVCDGAEWRLVGDVEHLARTVPESLRASIGQRIDRLPPDHQRLLEVASVAGADFELAAVGAALAWEDEVSEAHLQRLARQGWVSGSPAMAEWPDGTSTACYAFGHHLHQELLYARIPASRRARLHQAIGRRLESAYGDRAAERAGELALHFSRARDDDRTVRYHGYAAEHATARSAYPEAIAHLMAALAILERRPELPNARSDELKLLRMLGPALLVTRGWGDRDAERAYNRARELSELLEDSEQLASVLQGMAYLHEYRGHYLQAQALLEELLTLQLPSDKPGPLLQAHELLSCSLFHQGRFEPALLHAREGLDLFEPNERNPLLTSPGDNAGISCLFWAGFNSWFLGRPDEAVAQVQRAVELCDRTGQAYMVAFGAAQAARLFQLRRETGPTAEHARRAIGLAEREGFPYQYVMGRTLLGWAEVVSGDTSGLERLRLGLQGQIELGAEMERPYSLGLLADALAHLGHDEAALDAISEALALPEIRDRSFFWEAELHRLRGVILLRQGSAQGAEECLRRALEVAARQGARSLELRAAVSLYRLDRGTGRATEVRPRLQELLGGFREGLETPDLSEARTILESERAPTG